VIGVEFARRARETLSGGGLEVDYHEFPGGHEIDPALIPVAQSWLSARQQAAAQG
jgi:predicted esterase